MMYMYPGCGTTMNYVFLMTRLKPGHHFQPFPPPFLCTLPCTLPSTPAAADEDQAGSSILEEPDVTIWSQDEVSQEESGESGRQEEAGPCVRQEVAWPSVRQEVAWPSVRQEVAWPSVSQEEAGPSVSQ
ncbi:hypothetical protein AB205_0037460 [Aquarana catesbeiana]|uniref:Uncharacterized protein n=1 Tax=Aquarana catesbeiana TaxID=8400 RepID=A0A2G9Q9B5_AQUCT|nr:hypothetical protein AB205_0037460 [Aquarana catesbeiana]